MSIFTRFADSVVSVLQWEVSNRALEVLQNTKDAKGRTIEVCKIRLPPPLFRTYKEAEGLEVHPPPLCRCTAPKSASINAKMSH